MGFFDILKNKASSFLSKAKPVASGITKAIGIGRSIAHAISPILEGIPVAGGLAQAAARGLDVVDRYARRANDYIQSSSIPGQVAESPGVG
jgi:hypothetical protein